MRTLLILAALVVASGWAAAQQERAALPTAALKVTGMSCEVCAERVEKVAKAIEGVTRARVDQPKGTAEITYDPDKTSPEAVARTITEKTPFKATVLPDKPRK
ncbi:MAG TPA: heavy metal-associated domain-containing protein [Vicinamibacterales bacterium]|nr:heavy metal-associated domain-containing protein [Vicinamibacterales bacterium]